jgi:hypothetical protein
MQRYLQYGLLEAHGLLHFDSWASTFGETQTALELAPEGTGFRLKTRFSKFYNLPELISMFKECADIQTEEMLKLPVPEAEYHIRTVKPSEIQKNMVEGLAKRAEAVRGREVKPWEDNMLTITNDGRKLALDQRIMNALLPDFEGSKVNAAIDTVFEHWEKGAEKRLTQLIFCDLSTPKSGGFSVYSDIREKLMKKGVPGNEIAFIHDAKTDIQKKELFAKVRSGQIRVLLGSTEKMGAGTNVQNLIIASHDLDAPWRPRDLTQRSGRTIRQGNRNGTVHIYRYVTENTFDAYNWELLERKQKFISQIMTGKSPLRSCEDIDGSALSYAEIKALATGNPHIREKMEADIEVAKLKLIEANYNSQIYDLQDKIAKEYPREIARLKELIEDAQADIEAYKERQSRINSDKFAGMTVNGVHYTEKAKAGEALIEACRKTSVISAVEIGKYMDFPVKTEFDPIKKEYNVILQGKTGHSFTLGDDAAGNIARLNNALDGMQKELENCKSRLLMAEQTLETAREQVKIPFEKADELKAKTARLAELDKLLEIGEKDAPVVLDEERDNGGAGKIEIDREERER